MENPVEEIPHVIRLLTQSPPTVQKETIEKYFTVDAEFIHPFCWTGSWSLSRWLILCIYQWYKILSPTIELDVHSVAYDPANHLLYVNISQIFSIWFIPFHRASVNLTTVLTLARTPTSPPKYLISRQNDLYQTDQFLKFVSPFRIIWFLFAVVWRLVATAFCVLGAVGGTPVTWLLDWWREAERQQQQQQQQQRGRTAASTTVTGSGNGNGARGYLYEKASSGSGSGGQNGGSEKGNW